MHLERPPGNGVPGVPLMPARAPGSAPYPFNTTLPWGCAMNQVTALLRAKNNNVRGKNKLKKGHFNLDWESQHGSQKAFGAPPKKGKQT